MTKILQRPQNGLCSLKERDNVQVLRRRQDLTAFCNFLIFNFPKTFLTGFINTYTYIIRNPLRALNYRYDISGG